MEWLVVVIIVSAAVVTIVWFVKDIRKEKGQRKGFETLAQILANVQAK